MQLATTCATFATVLLTIDPRPCLPVNRCVRHEPELLTSRILRRVPRLPCPECHLAAKRGERFVLISKRPIAEPGPGGFGLKVVVQMTGRREFQIAYLNNGKKLAWREIEPTPAGKV